MVHVPDSVVRTDGGLGCSRGPGPRLLNGSPALLAISKVEWPHSGEISHRLPGFGRLLAFHVPVWRFGYPWSGDAELAHPCIEEGEVVPVSVSDGRQCIRIAPLNPTGIERFESFVPLAKWLGEASV